MEVSVPKLYVGESRVTNSNNLRFWPGTDAELNLERFLAFKHDPYLLLLDEAYDDEGCFQDQLYIAAHQRFIYKN